MDLETIKAALKSSYTDEQLLNDWAAYLFESYNEEVLSLRNVIFQDLIRKVMVLKKDK